MTWPELSIRRPTLIGSVFAAMIVVGLVCVRGLGLDMFPDITIPVIIATTVYPGAGPQEIETLVSKPLEEELSSLPGVKHLTSSSQDGVSVVVAEYKLGIDIKDAEQLFRARVDNARFRLPHEIDPPVIRRIDPADQPQAILALTGDLPPAQMYDWAKERIKPRLEQVAGVGLVEIQGGTRREIRVELDEAKLKRHEVSLTAVAGRIAASSQNVPVGKVSGERTETLYRTIGEFRSLDRIRETVVNFVGSDVPVTVGDLGEIRDTLEEPATYVYYRGQPGLVFNVYRQSGGNTVAVVDAVVARMRDLNATLKDKPGHLQLSLVRDNAKFVRMNVDDVTQTILLGICLTVLVVYFFLGSVRSTFITAMALPNSILGAFILMYVMGFTINIITLLALSLAVGLLVDDAIVVRENIWRHLEEGASPRDAAIKGTNEVALAVVATSLTVIAVFLPVGFLGGMVGQFFRSLGFTVVFAMSVSLFDAMTMAPLLSAYLAAARGNGRKAAGGAVRRALAALGRPLTLAAAAFDRFQDRLTDRYERVIRWSLRHRIVIVALATVIFFGSLFVLGPRIPNTFISAQDVGFYQVSVEGPPGTSLEGARRQALAVEAIVRKHPENKLTSVLVGDKFGQPNPAFGYVFVEMVNWRERKISTSEMKDRLRQELEPMAAWHPQVGDVQAVGNQRPFTMNLVGDDLDALVKASEVVVREFSAIKAFAGVEADARGGKPEEQIVIDPERARSLGVSTVTAGMELRGMVDGVLPAKYRENGLEYDIRVRLREDQRSLSGRMASTFVPNANMNLVRLSDVAQAEHTTGPTKVNRRDRARVVTISADLALGGALGDGLKQANKIMAGLKLPPGVQYEFFGQAEDLKDLRNNIGLAMGLAILFMYLILISLYESLIMPFLILLAVPLAVVGALGGLWITGKSLDIFSMIGMVMLLGLVAKNSILLVDYTIHLIRRGLPRDEALVRAGRTRLRPILMTTLALIAGMLPLGLGLSEVGRFRQSLGIAVMGGLLSSAVLTLVVVPACFGWADDFRRWTRRLFGRPELRMIDETEAAGRNGGNGRERPGVQAVGAKRLRK